MLLSTKELIYFQKTAEYENITTASEELHLVQPALSRSISNLENYLGVKIFDRVVRNISLNRYGKFVNYNADRILHELETMENELKVETGRQDKTVSVSLYAASSFLPELLADFKDLYPDVRIEIHQNYPDEDKTMQQNTDIAIFSNIIPIENDHTRTLLSEKLCLAVPDNHPYAKQESVDLSDFNEDGFISLGPRTSLRMITDAYCQIAGFSPNIVLESDSPQSVRSFIKGGLGIAFVPEITWSEVKGSHVQLLPIQKPECIRHICLTWKDEAYMSKTALILRDYIVDHFLDYASGKNRE